MSKGPSTDPPQAPEGSTQTRTQAQVQRMVWRTEVR
eukprot:CAMPEP_0177675280 /NCGR_PEP_ID=MMETSP0447-20121125/27098_1 /TAXON_ID=0 /ORGANISM="Stygamoeba regulata, Strain BSH-02190019" /LENGTH=35 /DNA_ID= /DNA_START= /DNA_END= /DNA_ORIENTATION=